MSDYGRFIRMILNDGELDGIGGAFMSQTLICQTKTPNKEIGAAKALQLKPHNKSRTTKKRP
jgi:hypothetical protein